MSKGLLILCTSLFLLSACGTPIDQAASPTETAGLVPGDPPATHTPLPVEVTPTPIPDNTPTTLPAHLTVTPTETHTWRSESPDGKWLALGFLRGPLTMEGRDDYQLLLEINNADGELAWTVYDEYVPAALGFGLPEVYRWAEDENTAYLTHHTVVDGCGILVGGSDLLRFDLGNGELETLFPGDVRAIGLSPDYATLAYVPWGTTLQVILLDLASGEQRSVNLEGYTDSAVAGALTWAADGHALALTIAESPCQGDLRQTIVRLDVETLIPQELLTSDRSTEPALLTTTGWPEDNALILQDSQDQEWRFDLESKTLAEVK
jgi:hypothetical protein